MIAHDDLYLGNYAQLFEEASDIPFPSWEALLWINQDHQGVRRPPIVAMDLMDHTEKVSRSTTLPDAVTFDPRFCPCPRRYLWSSRAKSDSRWYNWPKIPGSFKKPESCVQAYTQFSLEHHQHRDLVCFKASVFTGILAYLCHNYQFVVEYRVGARLSIDMEIFSKL